MKNNGLTATQAIVYITAKLEPKTMVMDYEFEENLIPLGFNSEQIKEALDLISHLYRYDKKYCPQLLLNEGNVYTILDNKDIICNISAEAEEKLEDILNKFKLKKEI